LKEKYEIEEENKRFLGVNSLMVDKKTLVLAVAISWILTLSTVLLINNFAPSLNQAFTQQSVSSNSVKVVNINSEEVVKLHYNGDSSYIYLNFSWSPSTPTNAIFGILISFEHKVESVEPPNYLFAISIWIDDFSTGTSKDNLNKTGEWETLSFQDIFSSEEFPKANQTQYPIRVVLSVIGTGQCQIRNVNLMLLVIGG